MLKTPYNSYQARQAGLGGQAYHGGHGGQGGQAYHGGQEAQGGQSGLPYQTWDYDREDYGMDKIYEKSNVENNPSRYQTTFVDNNREEKKEKYAKK